MILIKTTTLSHQLQDSIESDIQQKKNLNDINDCKKAVHKHKILNYDNLIIEMIKMCP